MATAVAQRAADPALTERLAAEVDHAVQRALKGIDLLCAPPPAVGHTPKTVLHRRGTLELLHYRAQADEVYRVPLLIVMAPTNKGFVLELAPGQSLVEFLLKRGYDVYMLDWNPPTMRERDLGLADYTLDFIPDCIRRVQEDSGEQNISLVSYCAGGMLSAIYQSLHPDGPVKNMACFTTPVDYSQMELFRAMSSEQSFDLDAFVEKNGVIPAQVVAAGFEALRPASRAVGQIRLWDNLWNDQFVAGFRRIHCFWVQATCHYHSPKRLGTTLLPLRTGFYMVSDRDSSNSLPPKNTISRRQMWTKNRQEVTRANPFASCRPLYTGNRSLRRSRPT